MTGAADVKVSVFNTDSKYKMKESQNNAAQFESSGIQLFTPSPLAFLTNGKNVRENRREEDPDKHKEEI
jgi:hypothetical protein